MKLLIQILFIFLTLKNVQAGNYKKQSVTVESSQEFILEKDVVKEFDLLEHYNALINVDKNNEIYSAVKKVELKENNKIINIATGFYSNTLDGTILLTEGLLVTCAHHPQFRDSILNKDYDFNIECHPVSTKIKIPINKKKTGIFNIWRRSPEDFLDKNIVKISYLVRFNSPLKIDKVIKQSLSIDITDKEIIEKVLIAEDFYYSLSDNNSASIKLDSKIKAYLQKTKHSDVYKYPGVK